MGQRSQIYVRVNTVDGRKYLFPRYYQWNYGERMLSRTRGIIEWLEEYTQYPDYIAKDKSAKEKLTRIMDTNFDYRDIVLGQDLIKEFLQSLKRAKENNEEPCNFRDVFDWQDNNDGQVFIDLVVDFDHKDKNGDYKHVFKYAFRSCKFDLNPMDPEQYMNWDMEDWRACEDMKDAVKLTEKNIRWIRKHAKLMTPAEMEEFVTYDYVKSMDIKEV